MSKLNLSRRVRGSDGTFPGEWYNRKDQIPLCYIIFWTIRVNCHMLLTMDTCGAKVD